MFDDSIILNPDLSKEWGKILNSLRESGETMLYAACSNLNDVYFTDDTIEITCTDDATFKLLTKHRGKLGTSVNIHRQKPTSFMTKRELVEKLEGIFGDKLTVQR
jgi:hypothetical protein